MAPITPVRSDSMPAPCPLANTTPAFFSPAGAVTPIFPGLSRGSRPTSPNTVNAAQAFNPSTLHCVHVPLAASEQWRKRLIPEYEEGDCWVCPRVTIRPSGKPGRMLLSASTKDLDGTPQLYEGIAELVVPSKSNPQKMTLEPKQSVASHMKNESQPRMAEAIPAAVPSKNWLKKDKVQTQKLPFNVRYFTLDPETGYVQNLVVTGDNDDDALILTRVRKPLYGEGAASRVLHEVIRDCRGAGIAINPEELDYSMIEEAMLRSSSPAMSGFLSGVVEEQRQAQRASITESFRQSMRHSLRQSIMDVELSKPFRA